MFSLTPKDETLDQRLAAITRRNLATYVEDLSNDQVLEDCLSCFEKNQCHGTGVSKKELKCWWIQTTVRDWMR